MKLILIIAYYFPPSNFVGADDNPYLFKNEHTYAIHLWNAAWFDPFLFFWDGRKKKGWKEVFKAIRGFSFYKGVFYHLKCAILGCLK